MRWFLYCGAYRKSDSKGIPYDINNKNTKKDGAFWIKQVVSVPMSAFFSLLIDRIYLEQIIVFLSLALNDFLFNWDISSLGRKLNRAGVLWLHMVY